jgi:hypothetical protein
MQDPADTSQHTAETLFTRNFILVFLAYFAFVAANLFYACPPHLSHKVGIHRKTGGYARRYYGRSGTCFPSFCRGSPAEALEEKRYDLWRSALYPHLYRRCCASAFLALFCREDLSRGSLCIVAHGCLRILRQYCPACLLGPGYRLFMLAPNIAMALAAPFGIFVMNRYGFTVFFLTLASLSLCSFFLPWNVKEQKTIVKPKDVSEARSASLVEWKIIIPAIANFLQMFTFGAIMAFVPLYAVQCGIANPGLFFTANALWFIMTGEYSGGKSSIPTTKKR